MTKYPYRCLSCGQAATEEQYQAGTCPNCKRAFENNPNEIRSAHAQKGHSKGADLSGLSLANFFIFIGMVSIALGVLVVTFSIVQSNAYWVWGIISIDTGLITVLLGLVARAIIDNANTSRKILALLESRESAR